MTILDVFMLCGGLGLFLYGMSLMSEGFERVAGDRLRSWLSFLTDRKIVGVLVGLGATAIVQSSSATTVMLVGFVNAGVMTLAQSMNVIMGASIGTTITGIIVAFKLSAIAPLFVLGGVVMTNFLKNTKVRRMGLIVLGFGILFLGMGLMGDALKPLGESELFKNIIVNMENPLLGLLVGVAITSIIQSSSAFTGILITLALQGMLSLEAAIPLIIGANIGTCATALLASLGTTRAAKRTAVLHLIYKIAGAAIFIVVFQFIPIAGWIKSLFQEPGWQVAAFSTIYAVCACVVLYPFSKFFIRLTERIMPLKDAAEVEEHALKYFTEAVFNTPALVVPQLSKEVSRMIEMSRKNLMLALEAFEKQSDENADKLNKRESVINFLNHELTHQMVKASGVELSTADRRALIEMLNIIPDTERIADHAQNIMEYVEIIKEHKLTFSDAAMDGIRSIGAAAVCSFDVCVRAHFEREEALFEEAELAEKRVDDLRELLKDEHIERLNAGLCDPKSSMIYTDLLGDLERVSDHSLNFVTAIL